MSTQNLVIVNENDWFLKNVQQTIVQLKGLVGYLTIVSVTGMTAEGIQDLHEEVLRVQELINYWELVLLDNGWTPAE